MRRSKPRQEQGFTLIEIMVVVVILGILAAILVPNIMGKPDEARVAAAKQDIRAMGTALDLYKLDNYSYPSTQQGLQALVTKPSGDPPAPNWKGPYIPNVKKDPWGHDYQYIYPGVHNPAGYDLYSLGADGKPGGTGVNADIGNWELSH
jgi:general secretion pathway protein G